MKRRILEECISSDCVYNKDNCIAPYIWIIDKKCVMHTTKEQWKKEKDILIKKYKDKK